MLNVDSLSRENYRNVCHMAKALYVFNAYTSIFYSILLLSHKNYRNVCHTAQILYFLVLIHQSFETLQGLLNIDSLSRENYRNVCHMAKILYYFNAYTTIICSIFLLSRTNYRNMCHMPQILDLFIHQSEETNQGLLNVDSLSREN